LHERRRGLLNVLERIIPTIPVYPGEDALSIHIVQGSMPVVFLVQPMPERNPSFAPRFDPVAAGHKAWARPQHVERSRVPWLVEGRFLRFSGAVHQREGGEHHERFHLNS
jgi:hypothetical protein